MAFATITMKPKPTTTPANMAATTNMTSPQARSYRDNRQHGPNVPRPQTRKGPAQGGAPAAGLSTPAELEGTAQESLTGVQWRS
jgi:hypothetical protein